MASKKILIDIQITDAGASAAINKTAKSVDNLSKSTQRLAGRTSKNKAESGLNNAILLETSRLASDASYGFQGMANNLGQLVSLFQIAATNSGGLNAVFKDLKTSIFGVGGIIVGVQLLISFLPQIAKKFKEVSDGTAGLSKAVKALRKDFLDLKGQIEESNEALIDQDDAMETLLVRLRRAVKGNIMFRLFGNTKVIDETIEKLSELGVEVDKSELLRFKHDPDGLNEYIEKLIENSGNLDKVAQDLADARADLAVERILGDKTPQELAQMELDLFVKTQKALGVEEEEYVKSKEYRVLLAKIEKAKRESEEVVRSKSLKELKSFIESRRTEPEIEEEKQKAVRKIIEKYAGENFNQMKSRLNKEFKLFGRHFKKTREQREKDAIEAIESENFKRDAMLDSISQFAFAASQIAGEHTAEGKALAVASATIDTYAAANNALKSLKPPLSFVVAAATIATGLANVHKILTVKVPNDKGAGAGVSGAGGDSVQAPAFNVVGASETSQLGMALGRTQREQKVNLVWDDLQDFNNTADRTVEVAGI